jgi:hypothetical protein
VKDGGKAVMIGLAQAGSLGEVDINRLVRRKVSALCVVYIVDRYYNYFFYSDI